MAGARMIPTLHYRDAKAAIDWLCEAYGFQRQFVVDGSNGAIQHAQLVHGDSMIMLGSKNDNEYGKLIRQPDEAGGVTQAVFMIVDDPDAHYARAKAAGAEIVIDIKDEVYGRGYTCRDPEGHVWNFGSYDPWAESKS